MKASRSAKLGGGGRPVWPPSLLLLLLIGRYEGFARLTPSVAEGAATALRFCAALFASTGDPTGTLHGFEWAKPAAKLCSPLAFDTRRASSPSITSLGLVAVSNQQEKQDFSHSSAQVCLGTDPVRTSRSTFRCGFLITASLWSTRTHSFFREGFHAYERARRQQKRLEWTMWGRARDCACTGRERSDGSKASSPPLTERRGGASSRSHTMMEMSSGTTSPRSFGCGWVARRRLPPQGRRRWRSRSQLSLQRLHPNPKPRRFAKRNRQRLLTPMPTRWPLKPAVCSRPSRARSAAAAAVAARRQDPRRAPTAAWTARLRLRSSRFRTVRSSCCRAV